MSKQIVNKHERMRRATAERQERYRMYKDGRNWVIAGMAALTFAVLGIQQTTTYADTEAPAVATTESTQQDDNNVATLKSSDTKQTDTNVPDAGSDTSKQAETTSNQTQQNDSQNDEAVTDKTANAADTDATEKTQPAPAAEAKSSEPAAKSAATTTTAAPVATTNDNSASKSDTTNLGDVTSAQVNAAKAAAKAKFEATGVAQKVTAVDSGAAVTGQVTIEYVDDKGQQIVLSAEEQNGLTNNGKSTSATFVGGNLVLSTTVPADKVTTKTVLSRYFQLTLPGYTWVNTDSDQTYAAVGTPKTIEDHYKANATPTQTTGTTPVAQGVTGQATVEYVDENDHQITLTPAEQRDLKNGATSIVDGNLVVTSKLPADLLAEHPNVPSSYFQLTLPGYTWVQTDADQAFATDGSTKIIKDHYKTNATSIQTTGTTPSVDNTVDGAVTVKYVDADTGDEIDFNSTNSSMPIPATQINGEYTATISVPESKFDQQHVSPKIAATQLIGYQYMGNDAADLSYAPSNAAKPKVITAKYEKLAPLTVNYVNEDDPSDIIYHVTVVANDPANQLLGGEDYDITNYIPTFYGYEYDASRTNQSALTGQFEGGPAKSINIVYKKTNDAVSKGSLFIDDYLGTTVVLSNDQQVGMKTVNPGIVYGATAIQDGAVVTSRTKNGAVTSYQNYTVLFAVGQHTLGLQVMPGFYSLANQPVEVRFVDAASNTTLNAISMGDYNTSENIIPSGSYNTDSDKAVIAEQNQLAKQNYQLVKVLGNKVGVYDPVHRVVYYYYEKPASVTTGSTTGIDTSFPTTTDETPTSQPDQTQPAVTPVQAPSGPDLNSENEPDLPSTFGATSTATNVKNTNQGTLPDTFGGQQGRNTMNAQQVASADSQHQQLVRDLSNKVSSNSLPQTGETKSSITSIIGLALASLFGIFGLGIKHRKAN